MRARIGNRHIHSRGADFQSYCRERHAGVMHMAILLDDMARVRRIDARPAYETVAPAQHRIM